MKEQERTDAIPQMMREGSKELFRFGTIDADYDSGDAAVRMDGDDESGITTHKRISSYTPTASDRVMMVRHGKQWVIMGKVV